ncbi:MAG: hypothetical protein ACOYYU_01345 [Chloroflexota bacterium]
MRFFNASRIADKTATSPPASRTDLPGREQKPALNRRANLPKPKG